MKQLLEREGVGRRRAEEQEEQVTINQNIVSHNELKSNGHLIHDDQH